jgi:hypothetical protein
MCMSLIVIAASFLRGDVLGKEVQPVYLTAERCVSASPKKLMLACLGVMLPIRCFSRIAPRLFLARSSRVLLVSFHVAALSCVRSGSPLQSLVLLRAYIHGVLRNVVRATN